MDIWVSTTHNHALQQIHEQLAKVDMTLCLTRKQVKNINLRLKPSNPNQLLVSAPRHVSDAKIAAVVFERWDWVMHSRDKLQAKHQHLQLSQAAARQPQPLMLWGQPQQYTLNQAQRLQCYRETLNAVMPELFAKWQPIVGKAALETRIKKMHTRWGSCNVRARRIWLSVYLPEYPVRCTEYVIVHELCHLHHANHGAQFWQQVAYAMPDYQYWHDMLKGVKQID